MRNKLTEIIKEKLCPIPADQQDPNYRFYYQNYADNLLYPMNSRHQREYGEGSGGELEAKGTRPAKMASIVSSSAMTFNLLGNEQIVVKPEQIFAEGAYRVEYEKKLPTLNKRSSPANLDAYLCHTEKQEAIFCEMKMMEWLNAPPPLKDAYRHPEAYFHLEAGEVFCDLIGQLMDTCPAEQTDNYHSRFEQYDAWQMLKHALAIYNATSLEAKEKMEKQLPGVSVAGQFKKITLANVVFEMDSNLIKEEKLRKRYQDALDREHAEADAFIKTVEKPIADLFRRYCDVDFKILYLPVSDFANCFYKNVKEHELFGRYCCK